MSARCTAGKISITAESDWADVTNELGVDNAPFTLARADGVGALQVSIATYRKGKEPTVNLEVLRRLLNDFASSHGFGQGYDEGSRVIPLLCCSLSFSTETQFVRA